MAEIAEGVSTGRKCFILQKARESLLQFSRLEPAYMLRRYVLLFFILSASGCGEWTRLSLENRSASFGKDAVVNGPVLSLTHVSSDSSRVYFRFPSGGLLLKKSGDVFSAALKVSFSFFSSYEERTPVDTGTLIFTMDAHSEAVSLSDSFNLFTGSPGRSILRLSFSDLNKNTGLVRYIPVIRKKTIASQDVQMRLRDGGLAYTNCFSVPAEVSVYSPFKFPDSLWMRCYFRNFPLAVLPFRLIDDPIFNMASDSAVRLSSETLPGLKLNREGIYFFQADTTLPSGFSILCFGEGFPEVRRAFDLIEATRYITTRSEYQKLLSSSQPKADIDRFWLDIAGNTERGRLLIRNYYGRMQQANQLFTSYMDGWKTDRGMIYMIFGVPGTVYTDGETEHWTYSGVPGLPELLFVFRKMNNPFTENDFALIRQPAFENPWYMAVDRWRQGRVVNDE